MVSPRFGVLGIASASDSSSLEASALKSSSVMAMFTTSVRDSFKFSASSETGVVVLISVESLSLGTASLTSAAYKSS